VAPILARLALKLMSLSEFIIIFYGVEIFAGKSCATPPIFYEVEKRSKWSHQIPQNEALSFMMDVALKFYYPSVNPHSMSITLVCLKSQLEEKPEILRSVSELCDATFPENGHVVLQPTEGKEVEIVSLLKANKINFRKGASRSND
jgi:hypothetical protein